MRIRPGGPPATPERGRRLERAPRCLLGPHDVPCHRLGVVEIQARRSICRRRFALWLPRGSSFEGPGASRPLSTASPGAYDFPGVRGARGPATATVGFTDLGVAAAVLPRVGW